ncbi:glutathione S-transferase [soil metagenome]
MTTVDAKRHVTLFHAPNSRSLGALVLLDELNADYELRVLDLKAGAQRDPSYLAINPMGKVPALLHGDALVTEQAAVYMYLADLYGEVALAPHIGDPLRGPYLKWMVFYGSCFEPALTDRAMKNPPAPRSTCPYGDFDTMLGTLTSQLAKGPYLLGDQFSAADVLWGMALKWTTGFKLVPPSQVIRSYIERIDIRPSVARASALDAELTSAHGH